MIMVEVTKIWWDGERLMAEPVDSAIMYKDDEVAQPAQEPVGEVVEDDFSRQIVGIGKWHALPSGSKLYTSPPAQRKPLTDEMVVAAARMLSDRQAAACNVDCGDMWKLHGNEFIEDARAALKAAHNMKEST